MLRPHSSNRYTLAQIFHTHWDDFCRRQGPRLRPPVRENVRKIMACRTEALGYHVYRCPTGCGHVVLVPHSCKSRFCPVCGKHAVDAWADGVLNGLLDVPYHHLVVSLPAVLGLLFHLNRKLFLNLAFQAAKASVLDWGVKVHGMRLGVVLVAHTFGSALNLHVHLHLLVTGGGLSLDGRRWIGTDARYLMNHAGLKARWKYHVLRLFRQAHKEGQWRFSPRYAPLREYTAFNGMLNKLYPLTWYAHIGASLLDPRFTVRYIGRYTKRAVLAEYRIVHYDGKTVGFLFKDYADGGKTKRKYLRVDTFLARLIQHIPEKHFPLVRYGGLFANRWRGVYLAQARQALEQRTRPAEPPATWRERQQRYRGVDPLICPACQVPLVFVECLFGPHGAVRAKALAWLERPERPGAVEILREAG